MVAASGDVLWTRQFGSSAYDRARDIVVDSNGYFYVAGSTSGSIAGQPAGSSDVFVRKFRANGEEVWTWQFGTEAADIANSLALDTEGNLFVVGTTSGSLALNNAGLRDGFVRMYDSEGNVRWTRQFGSDQTELVNDAAADAEGNV